MHQTMSRCYCNLHYAWSDCTQRTHRWTFDNQTEIWWAYTEAFKDELEISDKAANVVNHTLLPLKATPMLRQ
jgi:hypothetical protein